MERNHEELRSLIAPYVLGAVEPDEERAVRVHVLSCEECLAEAEGLADVPAHLAVAPEPEELPRGFSDRVLSQVRGGEAPAPRPVRRWARWPSLAGAALMIITAVLGVALLDTRSDLNRNEAVLSALAQGRGLQLTGTSAAATLIPSREGVLLVVTGLKPPPDDRVYQLWFMDRGEPTSAGTFTVDASPAIVELPSDLGGFDGAAITIEPAGGSTVPTTEPILASA